MKPEHKRRVIENELYACGIHSRWMPPGLRKAVKRQSHKIDRLVDAPACETWRHGERAVSGYAGDQAGKGSRAWEAVEVDEGSVSLHRADIPTAARLWMERGKRTGYVRPIGHATELEYRDGVGDTPGGMGVGMYAYHIDGGSVSPRRSASVALSLRPCVAYHELRSTAQAGMTS